MPNLHALLTWLRLGSRHDGGAAAHVATADRLRDSRRWAEAAEHYRLALVAKPRWTAIRVQLGNMLKEAGYHVDAEQAYRGAISEEPENADTHLQLGHALKLQSRHNEAREAYLAALKLDPDLQSARIELQGLGVSQRTIDLHLAAAAKDGKAPSRTMAHSISAADRLIDRFNNAAVEGFITDIGPRHVTGLLKNVSRQSLPLALVCRSEDREFATHFFELSDHDGGNKVDAAILPCSLNFHFDLPTMAEGAILHVRIEPERIELAGSPFILPSTSGASLVERIERMEKLVANFGPPDDVVEQLRKKLAPSVTAIAADRLETILGYQRETFERQLLALESRLLGGHRLPDFGLNPTAEGAFAPSEVTIDARDLFPGMGWSRPEPNSRGIIVRHLSGWSSLSVRISKTTGALLHMVFPQPVRPDRLRGLTLSSAGNRVPFWIEAAPHDAEGGVASFMLGAILPPPVNADGAISCEFESYERGSPGIPVSTISLAAVPTLDREILIASPSKWFIQGWDKTADGARMTGSKARILLPGKSGGADIVIRIDHDTDLQQLDVVINDTQLTAHDSEQGITRFIVPAAAWQDFPNILTFVASERRVSGDMRVPLVKSLIVSRTNI